jgi:hypothetical protein
MWKKKKKKKKKKKRIGDKIPPRKRKKWAQWVLGA